ncbi:MAG: ankyrin repeat domain-containing protein [Rhodospirillales bacterium]|nr:ankyrin repeat domain-containing protein [Rhodospirillales bacterium]
MKSALSLVLGLALGATATPAMAQLANTNGETGSGMGMGGIAGSPAPQVKAPTPDIAPAGLPGIGSIAPPATGPQMQKPESGDPTQELFTAINANDYGSAQDAVSRGADITAKDQFGETPLDLSIALNRNNITFLLLGTRNELASQGLSGTVGTPWTLDKTPASKPNSHKARAVLPAAANPAPRATFAAGNTGTPNPQAGFLGFGAKN